MAAGALAAFDEAEVAVLDLDGTLVDSNYQHALAWFRAFREHGLVLPVWRIHRAIGMGGDNLVEHLVGKNLEHRSGDMIRAAESRHYRAMISEIEPLEQARELIADLKERGLTVILASSAKEDDLHYYLELLQARDVVDGWTSADDVRATKPDPDLVYAALAKSAGGKAFMLGDSTWDIIAATRAHIPTICLTTGGFATEELKQAGAAAVFESIPELRSSLDLGR
jgi:HAD superfamily hydrolase (TIGR01549 family)